MNTSLPKTMRVIDISQPGGAENLVLAERPLPQLKPGEVLIQVAAAGVNRPDVLQRLGKYPVPPGASDILGLEVAGTIVAGNIQSSEYSPFVLGDLVCALVQGGGYAEYCAAPIQHCLPIPQGFSLIEATSLPETFFTVWSNVFDRAQLALGETLLVQGGSSGIGVTAIQLAHALGHRVFATAGTDEKCRACEQLGAERGIHYRTEDFVQIVKNITNNQGVDVILDMVAGDTIPREIDLLSNGGRLAIIALLGGSRANVDFGQVLRRNLSITGSVLRPQSVEFKQKIAEKLLKIVWPLLESGKIKPVIHAIFALEQAAEAHRLMESSAHIGKIVLYLPSITPLFHPHTWQRTAVRAENK